MDVRPVGTTPTTTGVAKLIVDSVLVFVRTSITPLCAATTKSGNVWFTLWNFASPTNTGPWLSPVTTFTGVPRPPLPVPGTIHTEPVLTSPATTSERPFPSISPLTTDEKLAEIGTAAWALKFPPPVFDNTVTLPEPSATTRSESV